jgi:hypothetical protein
LLENLKRYANELVIARDPNFEEIYKKRTAAKLAAAKVARKSKRRKIHNAGSNVHSYGT